MHSIKDMTCVVTGAAKSIGYGVAERYCALGQCRSGSPI